MNWEWFSKQGTEKSDNRDAGGLIISKSAIVALIIDGSSKGINGSTYVNQWIHAVIDSLKSEKITEHSQVISSMQNAHKQLQLQFLAETACYCALVILKDREQVWLINCGDCRIGSYKDDLVNWLTKPHRLEYFLDNPVEQGHFVTRCINAKRFIMPELMQLEYSSTTNWILASDGFWAHIANGETGKGMSDDRSYLRLSNALANSSEETDCSNWYVQHMEND